MIKMKKKLLAALLAAAVIAALALFVGCNKQIIDLNYNYTNAYVKIGEEWVDLKIRSWNDYDGEQLQITLTDGTVMLVSSYYCILYNGTLPKPANDR